MAEPTTDLDWWAATRYPSADDDWTPATRTGRHAFNEDAAETPIFHALSTGAWRSRRPAEPAAPPARATPPRRPAPDPVEAFRRDPLTQPIPQRPGREDASTESARRAAFGAHALRPERHEPPRPPRAPDPWGSAASDRGRWEPRPAEPRPSESRRPEPRKPEPRRPEPRYAERQNPDPRAFEPRRSEPQRPHSREPVQPGRREVSDSGRHHRRRPSISSLL